jgi:acyl phosphate:glycerol-3-phosphate acyltransferase
MGLGSVSRTDVLHPMFSVSDSTVAPMNVAGRLLAAGGIGYVVGMAPSADVAARWAGGSDLRSRGTGNPGGINASHVLGRKWGAAVSVADIGKGVAAGHLGRVIAGDAGANVAATAAVVGHCFPVGRSGGKGVATSVGQVVATFPSYLPLDMVVAFGTSAVPWLRQRTRTATTIASVTWVVTAALWWRRGLRNPGGVTPTVSLPLAAAASSAVILARFHSEVSKVDAYNRDEPSS